MSKDVTDSLVKCIVQTGMDCHTVSHLLGD